MVSTVLPRPRYRNLEESDEEPEGLRNDEETRCATCSEKKRIEDVNYLKKGYHICMPGQRFRKYSKSKGKLIALYDHHAIIKEVKQISGQTVKLALIHHTGIDDEMKIVETEETYDLIVDELYVVEYQNPGYSPDEIVRRAESRRKQSSNGELPKYDLATNNCEHFATWCVVGEEESFQVHSFRDKVLNILASFFDRGFLVMRFILRLVIDSLDEIAAGIAITAHLPSVVLGSSFVLYFAYCIYMTKRLNKQYKKKKTLCRSCFKSKRKDLWLQLITYGVTSGLSCIIVYVVLPLLAPQIGIPILVTTLICSTGLYFVIPRLRRLFLESPFHCDKTEIQTVSQLNPGDVISFRNRMFDHEIIVTEVQVEKETNRGNICGVHYSSPGWFSSRVIAEESFFIDLKKTKVLLLDCKNLKTFSRDEVVLRARQRIGEKKWHSGSNRSDNFCYWAKVKLDEDFPNNECLEAEEIRNLNYENRSTAYIGKRDVHLMNEIQLGDVLEFHNYGPFWERGILVSLEEIEMGNCRKFEISIIAQEGVCISYARLFRRTIDLDNDCLILHRYHAAHCHKKEKRAQRARKMLDKRSKHLTQFGFVEDCILLNKGR